MNYEHHDYQEIEGLEVETHSAAAQNDDKPTTVTRQSEEGARGQDEAEDQEVKSTLDILGLDEDLLSQSSDSEMEWSFTM